MKAIEELVTGLLSGRADVDEMEIRDYLRANNVSEHDIWRATEGSLVDVPATFVPYPGASAGAARATVNIKMLRYDDKVFVWEIMYNRDSLERYYGRQPRRAHPGYPTRYAAVPMMTFGSPLPMMTFGKPPEPPGTDKSTFVIRKYIRSTEGACAPPWQE
jgi:hypothetical protein